MDPPPATAIRTRFYAEILALPLSVFPIRRRLRARRGRCPKCGYDRTGLADPAGVRYLDHIAPVAVVEAMRGRAWGI